MNLYIEARGGRFFFFDVLGTYTGGSFLTEQSETCKTFAACEPGVATSLLFYFRSRSC